MHKLQSTPNCTDPHSLVWPSSSLDVSISPNTRTGSSLVFSKYSVCVGLTSVLQCLLGSGLVLILAKPSNNASLLQCLSVRERQMPWQLWKQRIHRAQIDTCTFLVVNIKRGVARQEENSWHGSWHSAEEGLNGQSGNFFWSGTRSIKAILHHVRLEHCTLQVHMMIIEGLELCRQNFSVILRQYSMSCVPFGTTSGSTIGQSPSLWQMEA